MIDRAESTPFIGASYTHRLRRAAFVSAIVLVMAIAGCGSGNSSKTTTGSSTASVTTAEPATASGPPTVVASGISFPSNLTFDPQGRLWVAAGALGPTPQEGIWYVPTGGTPQHVAGGLTSANGLVWVGNRLYVGSTTSPGIGQINVLEGFNGKAFGHRSVLIKDLQIGGHTLGTLALGPEGRLYVGLGAVKDHSGAPGTVVSFPPSGGGTQVEATGLRTAFGLAFWGPQLIVTDNGPDEVGPAPDQLLAFEPAGPVADFGFPACYGQGGAACNGAKPPLAVFPAHSAPAGIAVKGNVAYVADVGSAVSQSATASAIRRVDLRTGQENIFWRSPIKHDVVGVTIGPDGNLYATLIITGQVVRFKL